MHFSVKFSGTSFFDNANHQKIKKAARFSSELRQLADYNIKEVDFSFF
jgi:hypothetical protein